MFSVRFAGKVGLVTGAARGVGRATAVAFAREVAPLAILDRSDSALPEPEHRVNVAAIAVDDGSL